MPRSTLFGRVTPPGGRVVPAFLTWFQIWCSMTEEEHRMFLVGLQKLGKGDWRGIARNFVVSRTPTQVASHAKKYFIRQSNATRRKRRSSLFDMVPDMPPSDPPRVPEEQVLFPPSENSQLCNAKSQPSLSLSLKSDFEPMETTFENNVEEANETPMMMGIKWGDYIIEPWILPSIFTGPICHMAFFLQRRKWKRDITSSSGSKANPCHSQASC